MLVYNGVSFSIEIWEWVHDKSKRTPGMTRPLKHLRYLMLARTKMPAYVNTLTDYTKLSVEASFYLLQDLFELVSGISNHPLDPKHTTLEDLLDEYRNGLIPALVKHIVNGRTSPRGPEPVPALDPDFWEKKSTTYLSLKYPFFVYYMDKHIEERIEYTQTLIEKHRMRATGQSLSGWDEIPQNIHHINNIVSYVVGKIFRHYSSRDDFILQTKDTIVFESVAEAHEMMSIRQTDQQFDVRDDDGNPVPRDPYKCWRILYPDYFTATENVFREFFKHFRNACFMFFMKNFIGNDFGIVRIPIYEVYTRPSPGSSAKPCYTRHIPMLIHGGQAELLAAIKAMYKGYNDCD